MEYKAPVLLIIFNRPDTTSQVIEEIRNYQPTKLYIASDGPRNDSERQIVEQTRKMVINKIDWNCEVKTLFRKKNKGCAIGVSSAISWFFEEEDKGIILEDDCLPNNDFFKYCAKSLTVYEQNPIIGVISGFNPLGTPNAQDLFFSKYIRIWGWATWRRAWSKFQLQDHFKGNKPVKRLFIKNFGYLEGLLMNRAYQKSVINQNTWDYAWNATCLSNSFLTLVPKSNLIVNIGIEHENSTNTKNKMSFLNNLKHQNLLFPSHYPLLIEVNKKEDGRFSAFRLKIKAISFMQKIYTQ